MLSGGLDHVCEKNAEFPSEKRPKEMREYLSRPDVLGSSILPDHATELEKGKFKSCEMIIRFRQKHRLKQKELAVRLGIDEARMSEILHHKIVNFTLDRLIGYAEVIYPNLKLNSVAA